MEVGFMEGKYFLKLKILLKMKLPSICGKI